MNRSLLRSDGSLFIVEPRAADKLEDNVKGVELLDDDTSAAVIVKNYGTISAAGGVAVHGDNDDVAKIFNFGILNGGVEQEGGNDFFRNGGLVGGNVDLGTGNDLFKGWGGTVDGDIHGRIGNDTIIGGAADDVIFGDNGYDLLKGGSGDDIITGGAGCDVMTGGLGSDTFDFNKVNESVVGGKRDQITNFSKVDDFEILVVGVTGLTAGDFIL